MRAFRNRYIRSLHLLLILALAWTMTACIRDGEPDCFNGLYVRVVASTRNNSDPNWMGEGVLENVMLYVFDENEVLLDIIPTEAGRAELLFYPQTSKLHVASATNIDESVVFTEMVPGVTTLTQAEIALREADHYLDYNYYNNPPDIFSGQIEIPNAETDGVIDLPVHRRVAAVMIRVRGLKQYLGADGSSDEDYTLVFRASQCNVLHLSGKPAPVTRAEYPVPYKQSGGFRIASVDDREYYESPKQVSTDKTDFFRVFSLDEGIPVSVSIYYKDQLVSGASITRATDNSPLEVKNDLLNVIEIFFLRDGSLTVRVKEAQWNGVVEVEKDFGNSEDW